MYIALEVRAEVSVRGKWVRADAPASGGLGRGRAGSDGLGWCRGRRRAAASIAAHAAQRQVLRESRREPRAVPLEDGGVSARPRPPAVMPRWPER